MRFIRKNGRIIPIGVKKEQDALSEITSGSQNRISLAKIGLSVGAGFGALYLSGKMGTKSNLLFEAGKLKSSNALNRLAKITKFGGHSTAGLVAGNELSKIDKRSNDERATILNIGNSTSSSLAVGTSLVVAYGGYRIGKRFEYAGKLGKNLLKLKDLKSMIKLKAI